MKNTKPPPQPDRPATSWTHYLGLASQLMAALALSTCTGIYLDKRSGIRMPLLVWLLPLLVIAVTSIKLVKETARHSDGKKDSEQQA